MELWLYSWLEGRKKLSFSCVPWCANSRSRGAVQRSRPRGHSHEMQHKT